MGNIQSLLHSPKGKTLEHDVEASSDKPTLPIQELPIQEPKTKVTASVSYPESLKGIDTFQKDFDKLEPEQKSKIFEFHDAIQPHTDEGGDAYYIGDAYEEVNPTWASEWAVDRPGPYLEYIKSLSQSKTWHHLEYLAHWMEVTAAPPKWKFLRKGPGLRNREERAKRTHVCCIDYTNGESPDKRTFHDTAELRNALETSPQSNEKVQTRLLIVEDLSRDLVEMLGEYYDIDPLFFLSHINDYLFHNTRDRWVELPNLDIDARNRSHFNLQYLRPRYFKDEESFEQAERASGSFNVLRRLDSDRSRKILQNGLLDRPGASVTLTRAKTSLWVKPRAEGEPVTAILLVDPTVPTGHPLWRGNRPFENTPSMKSCRGDPKAISVLRDDASLFDELVFWSCKLSQEDLHNVHLDPKCLSIPVLKLVIADWLTVLKYMTTRLGLIEWEMGKPHWGENPSEMDGLMKKLAPWRRNIGYYQAMVNESIARLFPHTLQNPFDAATQFESLASPLTSHALAGSDSQLLSLWPDFKIVRQQMNDCHARITSIQNTATNAINIEESRRAVAQNKNLARLTFLATIFIPMNFSSSFLSMSPNFNQATGTVWLFFAIAIPLTLAALIAVDISHPDPNKSICIQFWKRLIPGQRESAPSTASEPPPDLARTSTIPWPLNRGPSSYLKQQKKRAS